MGHLAYYRFTFSVHCRWLILQSILKTVKYPAEELPKIIKCMVIFSNSNPDVINIFSLLGLTGLDSGDKREIFLLPPQGFGPEAKTRGGTLGVPACYSYKNKEYLLKK